jgi:hypothetical protein
MGKPGSTSNQRPAWQVLGLLGLLIAATAPVHGHPGAGSSAGHSSHHAGGSPQAAAHTGHPVAASGFHRAPLSGHGGHGSTAQYWGGAPAWNWYSSGWTLGVSAGYYAPWWWESPPDDVPLSAPADAALATEVPAVSYRFFCPTSSAYYPEVPSCPVPWLRVIDER